MNIKLDKITAIILIIAGALSFFALGLCCGIQHAAETLPEEIAQCENNGASGYIINTETARTVCLYE